MEDACLMYFNFNLFLAPTAGGLQWDQFGMWEVWVETTQTHCLGRHTKLTPPGPPFRAANSSSRYWFRIQSRELELKTFTPIIQQCFQSCIHTAYSPTWTLESLAHDFRNIAVSSRKRIPRFSSFQRLRKNLVCSFSPARSRN